MIEHFEECMKFIYFCGLEKSIETSSLVESIIKDYALGHKLECDSDEFVAKMKRWASSHD